MKVAIIGAGNVGTALATSLTRAGHDVIITARDPKHATTAAESSGASAATSNAAAVDEADVIIPAVPATGLRDVAAEIGEPAIGKPVDRRHEPHGADRAGSRHGHHLLECRGARGDAAGEPGRQGVQHALRIEPGRPHGRGRPARRLRGRRRRRSPRPRSSSSSSRSVCVRSMSGRWCEPGSSKVSRSSTSRSTPRTVAPGSRAGSSSARRRRSRKQPSQALPSDH